MKFGFWRTLGFKLRKQQVPYIGMKLINRSYTEEDEFGDLQKPTIYEIVKISEKSSAYKIRYNYNNGIKSTIDDEYRLSYIEMYDHRYKILTEQEFKEFEENYERCNN